MATELIYFGCIVDKGIKFHNSVAEHIVEKQRKREPAVDPKLLKVIDSSFDHHNKFFFIR